jgi:putative sterol carrier protein
MTVEETFKRIQSSFNSAAAAGLTKTIQLNLSGAQSGQWALRIANQQCELIPGGVEKPDLTLTLSDENWLALVQGRLNPMSAFFSGKIKASGDLALAPRLSSLFKFGHS